MTTPLNFASVEPPQATPTTAAGTQRPNILLGKLFGTKTHPNNGEPKLADPQPPLPATDLEQSHGTITNAKEAELHLTRVLGIQTNNKTHDTSLKTAVSSLSPPPIETQPSQIAPGCQEDDNKTAADEDEMMITEEECIPQADDDETMEEQSQGRNNPILLPTSLSISTHPDSNKSTQSTPTSITPPQKTTHDTVHDTQSFSASNQTDTIETDDDSTSQSLLKEYNLDVRFQVPHNTKKIPVQMVKDLFTAMKDQDPLLHILPFHTTSDEYPIHNKNQFPKEDDRDDVEVYFPNLGINRARTTVATILKVSTVYSHVQWRSVLEVYLKRYKITLKRHVLPTAKSTCVGILLLKHPEVTHLSYFSSYLQEGLLVNCPPFELRVMEPKVRPNLNATVQTKVISIRSGIDDAEVVNQRFMRAFPVNTGDGEFFISYKAGTEDDTMAKIYRKQNQWLSQVQMIPLNVRRNIDEKQELGFNRPLSIREFIRCQPGDEFTHPMDIENGGKTGKPVLIVLPQYRDLANNTLNDFKNILRTGTTSTSEHDGDDELDEYSLSHMSKVEQEYAKSLWGFSKFGSPHSVMKSTEEINAPPTSVKKKQISSSRQPRSTQSRTDNTTNTMSYAAAAAVPPSPRSQRKQAATSTFTKPRPYLPQGSTRAGRGGRGGHDSSRYASRGNGVPVATRPSPITRSNLTPTPEINVNASANESITSTMTDTRFQDDRTLLLDMHAMLLGQQHALCEQSNRQQKLEKEHNKLITKHGMMSANLSLLLEKLEVFSCSTKSHSDMRSLMSSVDDVRSRASIESPRWSDDDDDDADEKYSVHFSANESLIYDPQESPQEVHTGARNVVPVEWNSPSARHTASQRTPRTSTSLSISTHNTYDPLSDHEEKDGETTLDATSHMGSPLVTLGRTRSRRSPSRSPSRREPNDQSPSLRPPPKIPRTSRTQQSQRPPTDALVMYTPMDLESASSSVAGDSTTVSQPLS